VDPASPRMPVFDKNLNVKVLINAQDDARNSADPKANPTYDGVVKLSTTLNNLYSANVDTVDVDNKTYNAKNPKTADLTKAKVSLGLGQMTAILDADLNAAGQSVFTAAPTKFLGSMKVVLAILASDAPAGSADPKGNVSWADLNKTETINLVAFLNTLSSASSNIDAITMSASVKDAIDASLKRWAQPSLDKLLAGKVDVTAVAAPTVTLNNKLVTGAGAVESVAGPNGGTATVTFTDSKNNSVVKTIALTGAKADVSLAATDFGTGSKTKLEDGKISVSTVVTDASGFLSSTVTNSFDLAAAAGTKTVVCADQQR